MDQLTPNAVSHLMTAQSLTDYTAILQVLGLKRASEKRKDETERYRLVLSDGQRFLGAMLATHLNSLAVDGHILRYSLVRVTHFFRTTVQDRKIIIVRDLDVVKQKEEKLGEPESIETHPPTFTRQTKPTHPAASTSKQPVASTKQSSAPTPTASTSRQPSTSTAKQSSASTSTQASASTSTTAVTTKTNSSTIKEISKKSINHGFRSATDLKGKPALRGIDELSAYMNGWTIKARVTDKSDVIYWNNERGSGKLFHCLLTDETKSIKATAFNDLVDVLHEQLEEGKVYYISKARVVPAKKIYNKGIGNDNELTFGKDTIIEPCEDESNVPDPSHEFTPLANLVDLEKDMSCNILGIVIDIGDLDTMTTKSTQRPLSKRILIIVDRSGYSCRVALWGKTAEEFEVDRQPVLSLRNVRVDDYNGRSVSVLASSRMVIDPDLEEAHLLRGWFDAVGKDTAFTPLWTDSAGAGTTSPALLRSQLLTLSDVRAQNLGMSEPCYFTVKLKILATRGRASTFYYPACGTEGCYKKVEERGDGMWACGKCEGVFEVPVYRYITSVLASDQHLGIWFDIKDEVARQLFELTPTELHQLKETNVHAFEQQIRVPIAKLHFFKCKAEENFFNNQSRPRYTILRVVPVCWKAEIRGLVEGIKSYLVD